MLYMYTVTLMVKLMVSGGIFFLDILAGIKSTNTKQSNRLYTDNENQES